MTHFASNRTTGNHGGVTTLTTNLIFVIARQRETAKILKYNVMITRWQYNQLL